MASLVATALASTGCKQSKEDAAIERAKTRTPPAFIRIANFSQQPVSMVSKGVPPNEAQDPGTVGIFHIRGSAKQKVTVKEGEKSLYTEDLALNSGEYATLAVTEKGVKLYVQPNNMAPAGQSSFHVIVASATGPVSVSSDDAPLFDKLAPETNSDPKEVASGHHKITIKGADGKSTEAEADFNAEDMYSVFVYSDKSGLKAVIRDDSPNRKPVAQGGTRAG